MGPPLSLIVGGKPGKAVHGVWKKKYYRMVWYGGSILGCPFANWAVSKRIFPDFFYLSASAVVFLVVAAALPSAHLSLHENARDFLLSMGMCNFFFFWLCF